MKKSLSILIILMIGGLFLQSFFLLDDEKIKKISSFEHGSPLKLDFKLSGNFGEVRRNHFHAGLDIKTNGKIGYNVYNIADGYVSRIKISPFGYGKALYITHPEGYTSVYAHLDEFKEPIASFVKQAQYDKKQSKIDLYVPKDKLPVKRDDIIALSGNSGGSGGPHLHFEIRESASAKPINPLLFGFKVKDEVAPIVKHLSIETMSDEAGILEGNSIKAKERLVLPLINKGTHFGLKSDQPIRVSGKIAFGVDVIDRISNSYNRLGVYRTILKVDGQEKCVITKDQISFAESRYVNSYVDYTYKEQHDLTFHRAFVEPGNFLDIYSVSEDKGVIDFKETKLYHIEMILQDFDSNTTVIQFDLQGTNEFFTPPIDSIKGNQLMFYNSENHFSREGLSIHLPKNALYRSLDFRYERENGKDPTMYSSIHKLHDSSIPVHKYYEMKLIPDSLPEEHLSKLVVVSINEEGEYDYEGGSWNGNHIALKTRVFGDFVAIIDTVKPIIKPVNVTKGMSVADGNKLIFEITDDLSLNRYKLSVDGQWLLTYYDAKNDHLIYKVDEYLKPGVNVLRVEVTDKLNNKRHYQTVVKKI